MVSLADTFFGKMDKGEKIVFWKKLIVAMSIGYKMFQFQDNICLVGKSLEY